MGKREKVDGILKKIYYDPKHPASFGGVAKLSKFSKIPLKQVKFWLMTQDTYTLHKPIRNKFKRRKVISYGIGDLIQIDLVDMTKFAKYNKGYKYIITGIDTFSKFGYAVPIKKKSASMVLNGLKKMFKQIKFVKNVQTDFGKEFYNKLVAKFFKEKNIHHYSSYSPLKASVCERFNRTLKNKLYRIFTYRNSYRYIDVLNDVVNSYNNSKHRSTGYEPNKITSKMTQDIFKKLYGYDTTPVYSFSKGDLVRISKSRSSFTRGFLPNWTTEVFVVHKVFPSSPPTYELKDLKGKSIIGRMYPDDLQRVIKTKDDYWLVDKILKTRGRGSSKEYFVKWKGFDENFNSWIKKSAWQNQLQTST